jgi:hypothetical protein
VLVYELFKIGNKAGASPVDPLSLYYELQSKSQKYLCNWHKKRVLKSRACQQSVHLTLGILRKSQAVSYALPFFQLDGFAVPAPAQVTQTVGQFLAKQ